MPPTSATSATISIRLPVRTIERLKERAKRENTSVNALIARCADELLAAPAAGESAYDLLKDYIGVVASDGTHDATNSEQEVRQIILRRHEEQRQRRRGAAR